MHSNDDLRLKKLYKLLDAIRDHRLGLDWESKVEFNELEKKVIEQIELILKNKRRVVK